MTLIVSIACENGIVIASESASTDIESGIKQPHKKIKRLKEENILYGGSGDVGLLQKVDEALSGYTSRNAIKNIRQEFKKLIVPVLKESSSIHAPYPVGPYMRPPDAVHLFAGILKGKPWIIEIEKDGRDTFYGDDFGNFAAIGSGKHWAQAIFRPYLYINRDVELGQIFACRIICTAIELAAMGLAEPVQMYVLKPNQNPIEITEEEIESLKLTCETWKNLETETIGKLLTPPAKEPPEPKIPKTE